MSVKVAPLIIVGLLGATAGCTQIILPDSDKYSPPQTSSSSENSAGASGGGGGGGGSGTSPAASSGGNVPSCTNNETVCGSTCAIVASDAHHCGFCDHDCRGQSCVEGVCSPQMIASDPEDMVALAVNATDAYWTNYFRGKVVRASLDGVKSEVIDQGNNPVVAVEVSGDDVYWVSAEFDKVKGAVKRAHIPGGAPETIVADERNAGALALTPTHIFWSASHATGDEKYLRRVSRLLGGKPDDIAPESGSDWSLASDGNTVYAASAEGKILRFSGTGDLKKVLATGAAGASSLAVRGDYVYFTVRDKGMVGRVPTAGGAVEVFYDGSSDGITKTLGIAADDRYVYWSEEQDGNIRKAPAAGSGWKRADTLLLARGEKLPGALRIDDTYLYWVAGGSHLLQKTPK